jgi:hypothetical protein
MRHLLALLTIFSLLTSSQNASAQGNCDLIESVTLTATSDSQFVGYVNTLIGSNFVPVDLNQWQYIAITKDANNNGKIYKNGQLVVDGQFLNVGYSWVRIDIGAVFFTSYSSYFNGLIDDLRISNIVRSASAIQQQYNANIPLNNDANTIGLWRFDQSNGTTLLSETGPNGTLVNAQWNAGGRYGSCLALNGVDARASINQTLPTSNVTIEFWIKPLSDAPGISVSLFGQNTSSFTSEVIESDILWSTGDTTTSVTVDPSTMPYVWVTNGSCTDTVWFNGSQIDTVLVTVTDTLLINTTITGINPPNNVNTIRVFPNPALDHVTVDFGNYGLMNGYSFRITNSIGQVVYFSPINQQSVYLPLGDWSGPGLYFVELLDPQSVTVDTRHIVLQ